ncbi:hypothetical protein HMPREF1144_3418 [Klebsiella sp. OBRC7]|nr:hypothetical protein HMPREF1144_3418 [Klebsiella sp. OBRC7]
MVLNESLRRKFDLRTISAAAKTGSVSNTDEIRHYAMETR